MYLANDVVQNSRRQGPDYVKEFSQVIVKTFQVGSWNHLNELCLSDALIVLYKKWLFIGFDGSFYILDLVICNSIPELYHVCCCRKRKKQVGLFDDLAAINETFLNRSTNFIDDGLGA